MFGFFYFLYLGSAMPISVKVGSKRAKMKIGHLRVVYLLFLVRIESEGRQFRRVSKCMHSEEGEWPDGVFAAVMRRVAS